MSAMFNRRSLLLASLLLAAGTSARAQSVTEAPLGAGVERQLSTDQPLLWAHDPDRVKTEAGDGR